MVGNIKKAGYIDETKHNGGKKAIITGDVEICLICTVIDFPQWSGEDRASYLLSERGPPAEYLLTILHFKLKMIYLNSIYLVD